MNNCKKKYVSETIEFSVEFYDVDSMQVAWHGNYVKYMEVARCALLNKLDYDYYEMQRTGFSWPVVDLHVKYLRPLVFKQRVKCVVSLVEYEFCMKLEYKFTDAVTGETLTKAESTQMAFDMVKKESSFVSPASFVEKVRAVMKAEGIEEETR